MIGNVLLGIGLVLVVFLYGSLFVCYVVNRKSDEKDTGSSLVLKFLGDGNINLIECKEYAFSKYNVKRKMVKLASNTYNGNGYFYLAVGSLLAGYSLINNKFLNFIGNIFKEVRVISFSPVLVMVFSCISRNVGDCRLCLVLLGVIAVYQYMLNNINVLAVNEIDCSDNRVNKILKLFVEGSKLAFVITLLQMLRLIVIILGY